MSFNVEGNSSFPERFFQPRDLIFDVPGAIAHLSPLVADVDRGDELEASLRSYYEQFQAISTARRGSHIWDSGLVNQDRISRVPLMFTQQIALYSGSEESGDGAALNFEEKFNYRAQLITYALQIRGNNEGIVDSVNLESVKSLSEGVVYTTRANIKYLQGVPVFVSVIDDLSQNSVEFNVPEESKQSMRCYPRGLRRRTLPTSLPAFPNEYCSRLVRRNSK